MFFSVILIITDRIARLVSYGSITRRGVIDARKGKGKGRGKGRGKGGLLERAVCISVK